jgi:general secretion pathway protein D
MRPNSRYLLLAALVVGLGSAQAQEKSIPDAGELRSSPRLFPRLRTMHLTGDASQVIREASQLYGIDVVFAPPMESLHRPLTLDLTDANLTATGEVLQALARCFFVPVNPQLVLAVQDDKEHRSMYEQLFTETIEVPNMRTESAEESSEVKGLLSSVFEIQNPTLRRNSVTVRATRRELLQVEETLAHLYQPPPQVLLEVNAYMVSRNRSRNLGLQTPQQIKIFDVDSEAESLIAGNSSVVKELIAAGVVSAGDTLAIAVALVTEGYGSSSVLSSSFVTFGGGYTDFGVQFGSIAANMSLTKSTSQQLRSATLQLANNEAGKLRVGSRYPVQVASTTAVGGKSSSSTPSIQYEDLGLTLEAKPHVTVGGEVLLHIHETFRSLDGTSLNGIPIIDNQEFVSDLSVPAGMTTVMVSNLSSSETRTIQGFAALAPTNGGLDQQGSALVITVTPRLTRGLPLR